MKNHTAEREVVMSAVQCLYDLSLVQGSNGNMSMRLKAEGEREYYLITPSGVPYESLDANDLLVVDSELNVVEGDAAPSSESYLHRAIYRARADACAVVHTHSLYAGIAAVVGKPVPPILDEIVIYIGGAIEVAQYRFPGTEELAEEVVKSLGDRKAVILRNHGLCAIGTSMKEAVKIAMLAEHAAQTMISAMMIGAVNPIPQESIEAERAVYLMRSGLGTTDN